MSDLPTPETDAEIESLTKWPDYFVTADLARRLERERDEARAEAKSLVRHPDISECEKGHRFRTIASHPAKSEREWECPHCAVHERDTLRAEVERLRTDKAELAEALQFVSEITEGWQNGEFDTEEEALKWAGKTSCDILKKTTETLVNHKESKSTE